MDPKKVRSKLDEDPFKDLKIDNWMVLDNISERQPCLVCKKSRKYFCYNCYVPVRNLEDNVPKVKLPVKIDIIKHAREIDGKSTAAHAAVLAPDDVNIYTYPCIPDYGSEEKAVLVFPGKDAVSVESICNSFYEVHDDGTEPRPKRLNTGIKLPIARAIFIDSTWNQSRGIYKDQRLRDLPCVVLQARISQFWRHQNGSPRWYLATIEAVHQFLVELHTAVWQKQNASTPALPQSESESSADHGNSNSIINYDISSASKTEISDTSAEKCFSDDPQIKTLDVCPEMKNQTDLCTVGSENNIPHQVNSCVNTTKAQSKVTDTSNCKGPYNGEYDNLLFFFRYMYSKIHQLYDHEDLRAYKRPLK